jgi:hypothetical protein
VFADHEKLILSLRRERKLGIKQLRNELVRQHDLKLSLDTIHRVLVHHGEQVLRRPRRRIKGKLRYSRPVPGPLREEVEALFDPTKAASATRTTE